MALVPQHIPENDIIRQVKQVSDHNADLLIVDFSLSDAGVLTLITAGGDEIEIDLAAKFKTRTESLTADTVPLANESASGRIAVASQTEAEAGTDDTKAMTPLKTKLLFDKQNGLGEVGNLLLLAQQAGTISLTHQTNELPAVFDLLIGSPGAGTKICALLTAAGCSGKGSSGGSLYLSPADIVALRDYFIQSYFFEQGIINPATGLPYTEPAIPDKIGSQIVVVPTATATNESRYEPTSGLVFVSHVKGTTIVAGRIRSSKLDTDWHPLGRYEGTDAEGTYSYYFPNSSLPAGNYPVDIIVNNDTTKLVTAVVEVTEADSTPHPKPGEYRLWYDGGKTRIPETVNNGHIAVQQQYTDGQWYDIAYDRDFVPKPGTEIPGLTLGRGVITGDYTNAAIITQDTIFTIQYQILGVNYFGVFTLVNIDINTGNPPPVVTPDISIVDHRDTPDYGAVSLANIRASVAVECIRQWKRLVNGVEEASPSYDLGWRTYASDYTGILETVGGRSTVQVIWGKTNVEPTLVGTYNVYEIWRVVGETDPTKYVRLQAYQKTISGNIGPWVLVFDE